MKSILHRVLKTSGDALMHKVNAKTEKTAANGREDIDDAKKKRGRKGLKKQLLSPKVAAEAVALYLGLLRARTHRVRKVERETRAPLPVVPRPNRDPTAHRPQDEL